MESELDLRTYVELLARRWWFIVGLAVLTAAAALGTSLLWPRTYKAEAMVVFAMPRYVASFDPRLASSEEVSYPYRALPTLATSDSVLAALRETAQERWPAYAEDLATLRHIRGMVQARSGLDTSLVLLSVQAGDPQQAADLANAWGEVLVAQAQEIYGSGSSKDLAYFEQQLTTAEGDVDRVAAALLEFQGRDETAVLEGRRNNLIEMQNTYLREIKSVRDMAWNLNEFRDRLAGYPPDALGELADELTALLLQIKAYNASTSVPIQLQFTDPQIITSRSVAEIQAILKELAVGLEERQATISSTLATIEPQVLDLQWQIQQYTNERERLELSKEVAQETYQTIARKLDEVRLAVASPGVVQLASQAAVPESPDSPRPLLNTAVAGVAGGLLGVFILLAWNWWRTGDSQAAKRKEAA